MDGINVATLQGRLVDLPQFFPSKDGNSTHNRAFCRIAVKRFSSKEPDYFCITAWGKRAQVLMDYGKKGKVVGFTGHLHTQAKLRPDGTFDNYFELVADHIYLGPDAKDQPFVESTKELGPNVTVENLAALLSILMQQAKKQ